MSTIGTKLVYEDNSIQDVADLVHKLTHTSNKVLEKNTLEKLINICKKSKGAVERAYSILLDCLKEYHAEVRYNAFQICHIFLKKSSSFRKLLVNNLKQVLELTTEINYDLPLPPPKRVANDLKRLALQSVKEWNELYGSQYTRLRMGYNFLVSKKKVDFISMNVENEAVSQREDEEKRRIQIMNEQKIKSLLTEVADIEPDIQIVTQSLESCISMLVPSLDNFFITDTSNDASENNQSCFSNVQPNVSHNEEMEEIGETSSELREAGVKGTNYSIELDLPLEPEKSILVVETDENSVIIENAKDQFTLINKKYLPIVKKWVSFISKVSDDEVLLKKVVDLKYKLDNLLTKYQKLKFELAYNKENESEESDMEEVECDAQPSADDIITDIIKTNNADILKINKLCNKEAVTEPCCSSYTLNLDEYSEKSTELKMDNNDSLNRKQNLLKVAPKLPFDIDLYHWGDETVSTPMMLPSSMEGHKFWSASAMEDSEGIPVPDGASALRMRVIEFTGKFERSKWHCRALLKNGKLCPRQDKIKCPFHGLIVPRDKTGKCTNVEDEKREKDILEKKQLNNPDWQDSILLAEIKQATGVDLKMPVRGKRKKKEPENDLTDIKSKQDTPLSRLSKKIFNRSSIKRIASTLNNMDHRRFRHKFGDQFHYVHDTA